ncbi:MAG: hypothetical protein LBP59_02330 [Planctomycetaceae bacterium]|jgi:uncharacterized protein (TIGR03545 family)|nr:hypothetical protein [Planctomycetaceae bacterium]
MASRLILFIPRLLVLLIFFVVIFWLRDAIIGFQIRSKIERETGCKVSIYSTQSNLQDGEFTIEKLNLSDPNSTSSKNAFMQVDKIFVKGKTDDILRRYIHLSEVKIDGVQLFVLSPDTNSLIPEVIRNKISGQNKELALALNTVDQLGLVDLLEASPDEAALKILRQLETFNLAGNLQKYWQSETAPINEFQNDAATLREIFQNLTVIIDKIKKGDAKIGDVNKLQSDVKTAYKLIKKIATEAENLKQNVQSDYNKFQEALTNDQKKLSQLKHNPKTNPSQIAENLTAAITQNEWNKILTWRTWIDSITESIAIENNTEKFYEQFKLKPNRKFKGETIRLATLDTHPDLFIDKLNMTGAVNFGTFPVYFNCAASNVAAPMRLAAEPLTIQMKLSGKNITAETTRPDLTKLESEQIQEIHNSNILPDIFVTLNINRTGIETEDRLVISCPNYAAPERILGNTDKLAIKVSAGITTLNAALIVKDTNVEGQLKLTQNNIKLNLIKPNQKTIKYETELQQILNSINKLDAEIHIKGDINNPTYAFKSNIADIIAKQIENIIAQESEKTINKINNEITNKNTEIANLLTNIQKNKIEQIIQNINAEQNLWEKQIINQTETLPENSLENKLIKSILKSLVKTLKQK